MNTEMAWMDRMTHLVGHRQDGDSNMDIGGRNDRSAGIARYRRTDGETEITNFMAFAH